MQLICELNDKIILGTDGMSTKAPRITARAIVKNQDGLYAVMYADKQLSKMVDSKEGRRPYGKLEDMLRCEKEYLQICGSVFCMIASATLTAISIGAAVENGQPVDWISVAASTYLDAKGVNDGFWGMREFVDELKSKRLARKYIAKLDTLNSKYI